MHATCFSFLVCCPCSDIIFWMAVKLINSSYRVAYLVHGCIMGLDMSICYSFFTKICVKGVFIRNGCLDC